MRTPALLVSLLITGKPVRRISEAQNRARVVRSVR